MKLNNIIKIFVAPCQQISGFIRISETEAKISSDITFVEIERFKRPAALTISDKVEDGNRIFLTKLTFSICQEWLDNLKQKSFLCETVDGTRYLLGEGERPFPVVTQQQNHPNSFNDNQLTDVTINYSSSKKPPIIR